MPEKQTVARARADKRQGKAPSTQAGEFIKEEMDHIREGVHGARSAKQAIAIGLSKARRAGVDLPPPKTGKTSATARKQASRDLAKGRQAPATSASSKRSRASLSALKRDSTAPASPRALSRHAQAAAGTRSAAERSAAAQRAARTRARHPA
jgi:Family of unknown function (DUF6496)